MFTTYRSIAAASLLLLTTASAHALVLPDVATSGASAKLLYNTPVKGKKSAPALGISGTPFSFYRGDPALARELIERGIRERLAECGIQVQRNGSPVKGLRVQIGVDFVNPLNQFENVFTKTVKTNRDGRASVSFRQTPGDPGFAGVSQADFWSLGAVAKNGKKFDSLIVDCEKTEVLNDAN